MDHGVGVEVGDSRIVFLAEGRIALRTPREAQKNTTLPRARQSGRAAADAWIIDNKKYLSKSNLMGGASEWHHRAGRETQ